MESQRRARGAEDGERGRKEVVIGEPVATPRFEGGQVLRGEGTSREAVPSARGGRLRYRA